MKPLCTEVHNLFADRHEGLPEEIVGGFSGRHRQQKDR